MYLILMAMFLHFSLVSLFVEKTVDYHPDLGMECSGNYSAESGFVGTRWRGIRFEHARHKKDLTQSNTLYVKVNISRQ